MTLFEYGKSILEAWNNFIEALLYSSPIGRLVKRIAERSIDIIWCKECKHHFYDELNDCKMCHIHEYGKIWEDDDYCSYGEREGE